MAIYDNLSSDNAEFEHHQRTSCKIDRVVTDFIAQCVLRGDSLFQVVRDLLSSVVGLELAD